MDIYSIYKVTNIGYTAQYIKRRIRHKYETFSYGSQTKFHRAIRKYG